MGSRGTTRPALRCRPAIRLISLLAALSLAFLAIGARLVQLQVVRAEPLELLGARQRVRAIELPARRGAIYDRDMEPLAISAEARAIYANPRQIDDPAAVAATLAPVLGVAQDDLVAKLIKDAGFVYLARRVEPSVARAVLALDLPFVGVLRETRRVYPAGGLAGQVLGFVGTDNLGLGGLEWKFDGLLRGRPGEQVIEQDPTGRPIPQGRNSMRAAMPGEGLVLTIDRHIQYAAEAALRRGVKRFRARNGTALVLDTRTGDVLAMANWPPVDPNRWRAYDPDARRNRAVTDVYEPGSVNKVITAAAAIEAGIMTPSRTLVVPSTVRIGREVFHEYRAHPTSRWSYGEIIARSSNVGTIKVALRLGARRLDDALRRFGLGRPTGIGFPGESPGIALPLDEWYPTSIGTIPIGQGIAATPLQIAQVYATIANDGVLVRPRLVRAVARRDGTIQARAPSRGRRVVSALTAAQVRGMLVGAVEHGTGVRARLNGYLVAGKTGTARVPYVGRRGYSSDIIATFTGMAPADDPRFVVLVQLYNPKPRVAGPTAAPIFREIASFVLAAHGVRPSVSLPPVRSDTAERARKP